MVRGDGLRQRADMQTMSTPSATEVREPLAASATGGRPRMRLRPRLRRALLTAHIIAGVGLLGSVAVVLAINVRAATTADADLAASSYELLAMLTLAFGIPLSVIALATGVMLGLSSHGECGATPGSPPSLRC